MPIESAQLTDNSKRDDALRLIRRVWRHRAIRWFLLPLFGIACLHAAWTGVLMWQFESRVAALRAAGEPVRFVELAPNPVPTSDNAAPLLAQAHAWYDKHLLPGEPAIAEFILCDEVYSSAPDGVDREELTDARVDLRRWLASGEPYLQLLRQAAAKPNLQQVLDWNAGFEMEVPTGPQLLRAARFLCQRVMRADQATSTELSGLVVLLDLARLGEPDMAIQVLARWSLENDAVDALEELARKPGFDARAARRAMDSRLLDSERADLLSDALRNERAAALAVTRRWLDGESPLAMIRTAAANDGAAVADEEHWLRSDALWMSWWLRPLAYRDGLAILDYFESALQIAHLPAKAAVPRGKQLCEDYSRSLPYLLSSSIAVLTDRPMTERLKHIAEMRVARVGLALLELRQSSGEWPSSLDEVVPLVGASGVVDPYTGMRLEYEPGVRVEAMAQLPDDLARGSDEFKHSRFLYEVIWLF